MCGYGEERVSSAEALDERCTVRLKDPSRLHSPLAPRRVNSFTKASARTRRTSEIQTSHSSASNLTNRQLLWSAYSQSCNAGAPRPDLASRPSPAVTCYMTLRFAVVALAYSLRHAFGIH